MSLLPRTLMLLAVSMPLFLGGLVSFRTLPLGSEAAGLRQAIAEEREALEHARLENAAWEAWRAREGPLLEAGERILLCLMGSGSRVADLLPLFGELAGRAGVGLVACVEVPRAPREDGDRGSETGAALDRLRFELELEGPPERVLDFLGSLGRASRPITVAEVEVFRHEQVVLDVAAHVTVDVVVRARPGALSR